MKKIFLLLAVCMLAATAKADVNGFKLKQTDNDVIMGLYMCYSSVDSKYEDDNIILEIYSGNLYVTNKTTKTIFMDLSQCFGYYNETAFPFYVNEDKKKKNVVTEEQFWAIAPKAKNKHLVSLEIMVYNGNYSAFDGKKAKKLNDLDIEFLNTIEDMRNQFESSKIESVTKHYTEDEALFTIGAAISYSFSKNYDNPQDVYLSTWVSTLIIAKSYVVIPPAIKKEKSLGATKMLPAVIVAGADSPYEYDEEKCPIVGSEININTKNASFTLSKFNTTKEKISFWKAMANVGMGLSTGVVGLINVKDQVGDSNGIVINWVGTDADFSKVRDDGKGNVTLGNPKNGEPIVIQNKYD